MTIVLDLSPSIEQELQASAAHDGVPPSELASRLLASEVASRLLASEVASRLLASALRSRKTARRRAATKSETDASVGTTVTAGAKNSVTAASINAERVGLIKKQERAGLSPTKSQRLEYLQQTMRGIVNQSCPFPSAPLTKSGGN